MMQSNQTLYEKAVALFTAYEDTGDETTIKEAFEIFKILGSEGFGDAYSFLGYCYYYGKGTEKDYQKAVKWFEKGSDRELIACDYFLGLCYYYGQGVEKDLALSYAYLRMAAESGDDDALEALNDQLIFTDEEKFFTEEELKKKTLDDDEIEVALERVEAGSAFFAYSVAKYYFQKNRYEDALIYAALAKERGIAIAKGLESMIVARYIASEAKTVQQELTGEKNTLSDGDKAPNAVLIPFDGKPRAIVIEDFSSYQALARPIGCDRISMIPTEGIRFLSMIFKSHLLAYIDGGHVPKCPRANDLMTTLSGVDRIRGDAVICGFDQNDVYAPLSPETASALADWLAKWNSLSERVFLAIKNMSLKK